MQNQYYPKNQSIDQKQRNQEGEKNAPITMNVSEDVQVDLFDSLGMREVHLLLFFLRYFLESFIRHILQG